MSLVTSTEGVGLDMEAGDDGADHGICEAIEAAITAGRLRAAARKSPKTASVWNALADPYTRRAATLLSDAIFRLGADAAGPDARGEEW